MIIKESLVRNGIQADTYKFLSECYYLPDENLLRRLRSLDKSISELGSKIAEFAPGLSDLKLLKIDFSRLFVGPFKLLAPPYGSVYLESAGMVMGNSTIDVRNWYRKEGLDIALKETPDHITIELEFMYFLIFKEMEAIKNSDSAGAENYLDKQRSFLRTHLGMWVSEFARNVEKNAETEFYKNLARVTESFLKEDMNKLSDK